MGSKEAQILYFTYNTKQMYEAKYFLNHTMKNMKKCLIWVVFDLPPLGK
jgi:hypothetical protein